MDRVQIARAITVSDIAARARRVVGLANRQEKSELARLATPAMVDFLLEVASRRSWRSATPECRKSVASRPGDTVYVCRAAERHLALASTVVTVPNEWWLYFRKVDGRWTAVNKRLASSRTAYETERSLEARTTKVMDLAWAEDWDAIETYVVPAILERLQITIPAMKQPDAEPEPWTEIPHWSQCARIKPTRVPTYGNYVCGWLVEDFGESISYASYRKVDGRWVATKIRSIPDDAV